MGANNVTAHQWAGSAYEEACQALRDQAIKTAKWIIGQDTRMEHSLSADEFSAWNNFVEAKEAGRKAKIAENAACEEYMRAMDVSLEALKAEQAAFDVWLRIKKSLPPIGPVRKFPTEGSE
jgi:hypothetical protein